MTAQIINAAPMVIQYGTQDLSTVQVPREPEAIPQHLPKFYLYCQKGPTAPQLGSGAELANLYGLPTFDLRSPYSNHNTVYANLVNAEGNAIMVERVIPEDAGPNSSLVFWLDVLPTMVPNYQRNTDGSFKLDAITNLSIPDATTPTVAGNLIKWVITHDAILGSTGSSTHEFGEATIKPGSQHDTVTNTQSNLYPTFELRVAFKGEYGNNRGIRLWAPTTKSTLNMPTKLINKERVYPFYISTITRDRKSVV